MCQVVCHAWISSHKRMEQMCVWNGTYLYLVSDSDACIFIAPVIMFYHDLCNHCHNLHPEYYLLCQTHVVNLWIFCQFYIETYHLWMLLLMSIFCICPLSNWHVNVVRYDDLSSSLMLWYQELASIKERFFTLFNFWKILLSLVPLWTDDIGIWFSLARYKYSLTFPLGLGMRTELLPHSTVLSMPSGVMMPCCLSLSNFSLNGFCCTYATYLGGPWNWFTIWLFLQR